MTAADAMFILLQITDAAFPIGAYTHSYGLETYVQEGLARDAAGAADYIWRNLKMSFLHGDLLAARLAYEAAEAEDIEALVELGQTVIAAKVPRELRQASQKLGSRFVKTAGPLIPGGTAFSGYAARSAPNTPYPVAYGAFCRAAGIDADAAMAAFLYAQTSAMVTCCVKTIPLSQTDGQRILSGARSRFGEILDELSALGPDDLCRSCPGLDIRAMRHENLYSRLYMS
jgi:urease accessory protein